MIGRAKSGAIRRRASRLNLFLLRDVKILAQVCVIAVGHRSKAGSATPVKKRPQFRTSLKKDTMDSRFHGRAQIRLIHKRGIRNRI